MTILDLINDMYNKKLSSPVDFNMNGDRYTAYLSKTNKLTIEDFNQDTICIKDYLTEIELLDDCGQPILNTPEEEKKLPEKLSITYMKMIDKDSAIMEKFSQAELKIIDTVNTLITYLESKGE